MARISVVTSLYRSESFVEEFYRRCLASVRTITEDYEFIFVDDGSPDGSGAAVRRLIEGDPKVRLVELSRNFGHHKAVMTGLEYARGDYVFLLDSDLEEEPELLETFYRVMVEDERQPDVVYGYMEERKGGWGERLPGALFYLIMNRISEIHIPPNALVARLMTQGYVRNLLRYQESHVFLGGILQLTGYTQVGVPASKTSKGTSTYTLAMKLSQAMDAILSFTNKPLTYIAAVGLVISGLSFLVALYLGVGAILYRSEIDGWVLVLASLWFLGGLIISSIGFVGFYVGRIFLQVKGRPNVVVKRVYNEAGDGSDR